MACTATLLYGDRFARSRSDTLDISDEERNLKRMLVHRALTTTTTTGVPGGTLVVVRCRPR
ncbi:Hypothetical protein CAP_4295 [Chondromyces apiculatus DSM 436]|uniref:Uncharacterized protein n=1 Tax=Chondromyces apiculatus DSM 436 TaxID=1192034 RepID=A0A017T5Z3_9BACT|nr:Hypothetical protein CAP_4295 [Chondromyces apiculatus DSM 436]